MTTFVQQTLRGLALTALVLGAAFGLAACGDTPTATPAAPTATSNPTAGDSAPTTAPTGKTNTVEVTLNEWSITPKDVSIPPGATTFKVTNAGKFPHDFVVMNSGTQLTASKKLAAGESQDVTVDIPAGSYQTLCDVPGHKEQGMQGTLTSK